MKRTAIRPSTKPMRRTPMRKVPTETPGVFRLAGKLWPVDWMPEEPNRRKHETSWRETVEERAHQFGWALRWHCNQPQRSEKGWFDLTLFHPKRGKHLFVELKVRDRVGGLRGPTPWQLDWVYGAIACGLDARVWVWPDDDDECWETLRGDA